MPSTTSLAPVTTPEKILATLPSAAHPPKPAPAVIADMELQWIFTDAELARTPSVRAGMEPRQERQLRAKGLSFISQAGIMLKLPQIALHTASLFFNRFLMRYSLVHDKRLPKPKGGPRTLHVYQIGALALHLSTKVSETPRKLRDIIVACVRVALHNANLLVPEDSKDFWRWRDTLLLNEDLMLETLCFDIHVESPHRILFDMLKILGAEHNKRLRNSAWAFVNDAGATTLGLRFSARTIAASAIYAAAKHCEYLDDTDSVRFKDDARTGKPWWSVHGIELREIRRCCNAMAELYEAEPVKAGGTPGREMVTGDADGGDGEESMYKRLRTPSQGPEDGAPTRAKRKSDGTPKPESNGDSQAQHQSQPAPQPQGPTTIAQQHSEDDRGGKKSRTEDKNLHPGESKKKDDNASEEGEVDE